MALPTTPQSQPRHASSSAAAIAERYRVGVILLSATLLSSYGLLIQASKTEAGDIPYNSASVNFLIETSKELICLLACVYFDRTKKARHRHRIRSKHHNGVRTSGDDATAPEVSSGEVGDSGASSRSGDETHQPLQPHGGGDEEDTAPLTMRERLLFALPALLYTIDNNLTFVILQYLDAATVAVVWNLKILTTAIMYRWVLQRPIRNLQWMAIWLLLFGIVTTQSHKLQREAPTCSSAHAANDTTTRNETNSDAITTAPVDFNTTTASSSPYLVGMVLVLVAVTLSSMAGICCEYIYKRRPHMSYVHQNAYFCAYGMLFNGLTLIVESSSTKSGGSHHRWFEGYSALTLLIVANSTATGLLVGFMFKVLDNIAVVFAHAESMILTAVLSVLLFGFSLGVEFACGVGVSVIALYLYDADPTLFLVDAATSGGDRGQKYAPIVLDDERGNGGCCSPHIPAAPASSTLELT